MFVTLPLLPLLLLLVEPCVGVESGSGSGYFNDSESGQSDTVLPTSLATPTPVGSSLSADFAGK